MIDVWELRKVKVYSNNPNIQQSRTKVGPGELQGVAEGRGELCLGSETDTCMCVCSSSVCSSMCGSGKGVSTVHSFSSGSTYSSGCIVDGPSAMAAP